MKKKDINVLIIEDSKLESDLIQDFMKVELRKRGFHPKIRATSTEVDSYQALSQNEHDIVIFDIDLDKREAGLDLLKKFSKKIPFPVMSSCRQSHKVVEKAYQLDCKHFLNKPIKQSKVSYLIANYKRERISKDLFHVIKSKYITRDEETLNELYKIISCENAHIFGPTGVGKQVVAELIHEIHKSDSEPFVERNCSSVTDSLAESFLFGHKKGAFTGANDDRKGIFELANDGTVFLDEIDKTSKSFQSKLLKVVEKKEVVRVGCEISRPVNFSLVTASSTDLNLLTENGGFLPDLWERLQGEVIHLRSLKDRPLDIELQIQHFIRTHESGRLFIISNEASYFLTNYHWPGNTRELKNVIDKFQRKNIKILKLENLKFLQNKSIRQKYNLIGHQILKAVEKQGLKKVVDQISKEVIHHFFTRNQEKKRPTMRQLDISSDTLYKHLREIKEEVSS